MAGTITNTINLVLDHGNLTDAKNVECEIVQTTNGKSAGVQTIGFAAHELLTVEADLVAAGVTHFRNLDATNYVNLGLDVSGTFHPLLKLKPGEAYVVRLATLTIYAKAAVAAVKLEKLFFDD